MDNVNMLLEPIRASLHQVGSSCHACCSPW